MMLLPWWRARAVLAASVALMLTAWEGAASSQAPPAPQPPTYTIKDLGTLCVATPELSCDAAISRAFDVNNWGQVVGSSHTIGTSTFVPLLLRAFRTEPNQAIDPFNDALGFGDWSVEFRAYSINDAGAVVGGIGSSFPDWEYETETPRAAFLVLPNSQTAWDLRSLSLLNCPPNDPPVPFGCRGSLAFGINNDGLIVGGASVDEHFLDLHHAFRFNSGVIEDLGTPPFLNLSQARGINDSGLIVGFARLAFIGLGTRHAVLFSGGAATELGTLGGSDSAAYAINNGADPDPQAPASAQIVGESGIGNFTGASHAFVLPLGVIVPPGSSGMLDLGTLCPIGTCNSAAFDINDLGRIVGQSEFLPGSSVTHAFVYRNNQMTDLNTQLPPVDQSRWLLIDARGINDFGQIVGTGFFHAQMRGYLMTPPLSSVFAAAKELAALFLGRTLPGIALSLNAKLESAEVAVGRQQVAVALQQITAYELEVQALVRSRLLTKSQGTKLVAGAALIQQLSEERLRR